MSRTGRDSDTPCYLKQTGSFLPGSRIANDQIADYLGEISGEQDVKRQVLRMNGIVGRYFAQDAHQTATHDVYELAALAVKNCLDASDHRKRTYRQRNASDSRDQVDRA